MAFRMPAIMKTTAARLSAMYLVLFMLCAVALVFYISGFSERMLIAQTQQTIEEEVQGLASAYQRGGIPLLVRFVTQRARQPGANLYLLADPNGAVLSGNVASIQPGVLDTQGWTTRPFSYERYGEPAERSGDQPASPQAATSEKRHAALAVVLRLPNQMILLVGRDLGEPERFRNVIQRSLMLALGMMALGGLLIWYFVGRSALKRIDKVSEASQRIMDGDLSRRLPVSGAGDEFDRLSENLNAMLARIGKLNEGLKQVSDNIAHDLKTPLTRLRNRAEAALGMADADTAAYREALEGTIAESDQLIRTFNAILMISRLEAGYSAEHTETVDLSAIVHDVVELYDAVAEECGVVLTSSIADGVVVEGNRELLGQALSNVVDNAIKYSAGNVEAPKVAVDLRVEDHGVLVAVADNGIGIPDPADRARAMERFVRLEQSRSQPGSGLGLSLATAIVQFHNGTLRLRPADPGLIVELAFPTARKATE